MSTISEEKFFHTISSFKGLFWDKLLQNRNNFYILFGDGEGITIVNIVGKGDHNMTRMGKEFGFPRGFPIIIDKKTGRILTAIGFFPKFGNDDRQTRLSTQVQDLPGESKKDVPIEASLKMSGFLCGAILYMKDGIVCFKGVSKNSGENTSPFVQTAHAMWGNLLDQKTLDRAYANGIRGFWGECMAKNDQVHAYGVLKEAIVITGISYGINKDATWPKTLGGAEMLEVLKMFPGLSNIAAKPFIITPKQLAQIENNRDLMTFSPLKKILPKLTNRHLEMVGERVEGLIIRIPLSEGVHIVKYKFPFYTMVTMPDGGIRTLYANDGVNNLFRQDGGVCKNVSEGITAYLKRWVVNPSNRALFRTVIYKILQVLLNLQDDSPVAPWIRATDIVFNEIFDPATGVVTLPGPTEVKEYKIYQKRDGTKMIEPASVFQIFLAACLSNEDMGKVMGSFMSYTGSLKNFLVNLENPTVDKLSDKMDLYFAEWRNAEKHVVKKGKKPKKSKGPKTPKQSKGVPEKILLLGCDEKMEQEGYSDKTVITQRGPSGVGKTRQVKNRGAKKVGDPKNNGTATVVSADFYFEEKGECDMTEILLAHTKCYRWFLQAIARGDKLVIISNTNVKVGDFKKYLEAANLFGYSVLIEHVDSFNLGIYEMGPEEAWAALSAKLKDTNRGASWQGMPLKKVFLKHFNGILANPHPFQGCTTLAHALVKPLKISEKKGSLSLSGSPLDKMKAEAIRKLTKVGISSEWVVKCLARDNGGSHITCHFVDKNPLSAEQKNVLVNLELFTGDIVSLGIGVATKDEQVAYYVIVQCDKIQTALKKAGLPPSDLHITLAFKDTDVHDVPKDSSTLLPMFT